MASLMRKYFRKAKNEWNSYSEVQILVREATSNDPWGPSMTLMGRIAREAESPANYHMMFTTLWKRLTDYQHNKHVLKALALIEYLLKHCHERFVSDVRLRSDVIRRLKHYKYFVDGRDVGAEVRHKAQGVMSLLENKELLTKERKIARETEGRFKGYSNEYEGRALEGADPFGEDRLQLEYRRDESFNVNHDEHKSEEEPVDYEVEEEKPKKKKGKKSIKKKRSSKKAVQEMEEDQEGEQDDEAAINSPPQNGNKDFFEESDGEQEPRHVDATDDFLSSLGNSKPIYASEPDLVTGGMNHAAKSQFGWLATINNPSYNSNALSTDLALFDMEPASSAPKLDRRNSDFAKPAGSFLFESEDDAPAAPFVPEQKAPEVPSDPWELAKEISVLDNLRVTGDERKIKENLQSRRDRERTGPKLKDLTKQAREKNNEANPFDAMVMGQPDPAHTGNFAAAAASVGSMALVPAGQFYDPNYAQALVPVQPYGYGYTMPAAYPPMMYPPQDQYGYPRY